MKKFPKARMSDIVVSDYKDEVLVYDLKTHRCHSLNKTAYTVWRESNGKRGLSEIANKIDRRLSREAGDELVILALAELENRGLLEKGSKYGFASSVSRRQMITRIGKATLVALPFITSITAPKAVAAQSGSGCPTGSVVCGTGCCALGVQTCISNMCCPNSRACMGTCCNSGEICNSGSCCATANVCGANCCTTVETCCGGMCCNNLSSQCVGGSVCCPSNRACGSICCPSGQTCVNPFSSTCA